jgi:hypothetical protein
MNRAKPGSARTVAGLAAAAAALALAAAAFAWRTHGRGTAGLANPSTGRGVRPPKRASPGSWFEDRTAAAGITFRQGHHGGSPLPVVDLMGTGCALFDYDGDGRVDLFLIGQEGTGNTGRCALYRNNGAGTFADVTAGSGLEQPGRYMGCAVADVDNDSRPDLLLSGYGVCRLYRNLGGGKFQDRTLESGLAATSPTSWYSSAAFGDVDRDGLVDLYLGRYVVYNAKTIQLCNYGQHRSSCGPRFYDPQFGSLYRGLGGTKFADYTRRWGLADQQGKCLGAAFADVNNDGWPDLYLGNDEMPGDLYINQQGKRFRNEALAAGVALSREGKMQGAMGVDFGDFNRDGRQDLVVTTFEYEPDSLYLNGEQGVFQSVGLAMGLDLPTHPLVGFGTKFADFDNDGWSDLAIANGHIHDNAEVLDRNSHYRQPAQLFLSERGERFVDRSVEAGPGFTEPAVGRGLAVGDLDNDGRQDLVLTDLEGPPRVLYNRIAAPGSWLRITLKGRRSNRLGIGARVRVTGGSQRWTAEATTGGSYLSASDPRVHVGLGGLRRVDRVEVSWPSGRRSEVRNPVVPGDLMIEESE